MPACILFFGENEPGKLASHTVVESTSDVNMYYIHDTIGSASLPSATGGHCRDIDPLPSQDVRGDA